MVGEWVVSLQDQSGVSKPRAGRRECRLELVSCGFRGKPAHPDDHHAPRMGDGKAHACLISSSWPHPCEVAILNSVLLLSK